jgi:hypothetical protein
VRRVVRPGVSSSDVAAPADDGATSPTPSSTMAATALHRSDVITRDRTRPIASGLLARAGDDAHSYGLEMADVTVFVDRAVQGDLPGVCVIDGVDTADVLTVRRDVGDGTRLGVAWLLVLAGPLGWIGLFVIAAFRSGRAEVLTVQLPYSAAAYARLRAARRQQLVGWSLVTATAVAVLVVASANPWVPATAVVIAAAIALAVCGLVVIARSAWRRGRVTVGVELDASRRWVTLRSVHPRFAAATTNSTDIPLPTP